jgi:hypothetical protein
MKVPAEQLQKLAGSYGRELPARSARIGGGEFKFGVTVGELSIAQCAAQLNFKGTEREKDFLRFWLDCTRYDCDGDADVNDGKHEEEHCQSREDHCFYFQTVAYPGR